MAESVQCVSNLLGDVDLGRTVEEVKGPEDVAQKLQEKIGNKVEIHWDTFSFGEQELFSREAKRRPWPMPYAREIYTSSRLIMKASPLKIEEIDDKEKIPPITYPQFGSSLSKFTTGSSTS